MKQIKIKQIQKFENIDEDIKEKDLVKEVEFNIDRDAFKGPFICCGTTTKKKAKKLFLKGIDFSYGVWRCSKCKKEYLDTEQANRLEKLWMVEKILSDKLISMERNVNYDGKTFFVRFPVEVTKKWHKGLHAEIKLINQNEFLIKVKV